MVTAIAIGYRSSLPSSGVGEAGHGLRPHSSCESVQNFFCELLPVLPPGRQQALNLSCANISDGQKNLIRTLGRVLSGRLKNLEPQLVTPPNSRGLFRAFKECGLMPAA